MTPKPRPSVRALIREWASNSSCNGVSNIEKPGSPVRKIAWIAIVLAGTGCALIQVTNLVLQYYEYPVSINVNVTYAKELAFPAITFCNVNAARNSFISLAGKHFSRKMPQRFKAPPQTPQGQGQFPPTLVNPVNGDLPQLPGSGDGQRLLANGDGQQIPENGPGKEISESDDDQQAPPNTDGQHLPVKEMDQQIPGNGDGQQPLLGADDQQAETNEVTQQTPENEVDQQVAANSDGQQSPPGGGDGHQVQASEDPQQTSGSGDDQEALASGDAQQAQISGDDQRAPVNGGGQQLPANGGGQQPPPVPNRKKRTLESANSSSPPGTANPPLHTTDTPDQHENRTEYQTFLFASTVDHLDVHVHGNDTDFQNVSLTPGVNASDTRTDNNSDSRNVGLDNPEDNPDEQTDSSASGGGDSSGNHWWDNLADAIGKEIDSWKDDSINGSSWADYIREEFDSWEDSSEEWDSYEEEDWGGERQLGNARYADVLQFTKEWVTVPEEDRTKIGHQLEDMLADCVYNGEKCTTSDFNASNHILYGNCYTFNSGRNPRATLNTYRAGAMYGLSMELNLQQGEYIPELTDSAGLRLIIHSSRAHPSPEDKGLFISPKTITSVSVRLSNITRLPAPYPSHCVSLTHDEAMELDVYTERYDVDYSMDGCLKTCYQRHLFATCGCGNALIPLSGKALRLEDHSNFTKGGVCYTANQTKCEDEVFDLHKEGRLPCNCSIECVQLSYQTTVTTGEWPNKMYQTFLISKLNLTQPAIFERLTNAIDQIDHIGENFLKVVVYFEELNYEHIVEKRMITKASLLADMGGSVGFYLGLSIIALFEFLELFVDVIRILILKLSAKCSPNNIPRLRGNSVASVAGVTLITVMPQFKGNKK